MRPASATELKVLGAALRQYVGPRLPGSVVRKKRLVPGQFNLQQLAIGTVIELEHTNSRALALEIAMAHLHEDARYYEKLERMEARR